MMRLAVSLSTAAIAILIATAASAADMQAMPRHYVKSAPMSTLSLRAKTSRACLGMQGNEKVQCECQQLQIETNSTCTVHQGPPPLHKPVCTCI